MCAVAKTWFGLPIDFCRLTGDDGIQCVGPKLQRGPFLYLILTAVVDPVGDTPLALATVVQDSLTNVFGNAVSAEIGADRA